MQQLLHCLLLKTNNNTVVRQHGDLCTEWPEGMVRSMIDASFLNLGTVFVPI